MKEKFLSTCESLNLKVSVNDDSTISIIGADKEKVEYAQAFLNNSPELQAVIIHSMAAKDNELSERLNARTAALHQDIPHNAEQPPQEARPKRESHSVIGGKFNKFQRLRTLQDFKAECAKHNITFVAGYEYSTPRVFLAVPDYRKTDIMSELQYWLHARPELERALHKAIL